VISADCSRSQQELSHKAAQHLMNGHFVSLSEITNKREHSILLQAKSLSGI